jgi:hypothetical protein
MRVKAVRIIFFLLIVFLAMPEFVLGVPSLVNGIRAHGDVWSVRHDYFGDAAFTLIAGLLAVGFAAWAAFWPGKANWLRFVVATGLALWMAATLGSWYTPPLVEQRRAVNDKVWEMGTAAQAWASENGSFPLNDGDVVQLMTTGRLRLGDSPFQHGRAVVPYELKVISKASGPVFQTPRPGMIYYAVDATGQRFWITGTGLSAPISMETVVIEDGRKGGRLVMTAEIESPNPATVKTEPKK